MPLSINEQIYILFQEIEKCAIQTDPLKLIPLLFLLYLNANDYFLSLDKVAKISYISVSECLTFTEDLRRFEFDEDRCTFQNIKTYTLTFPKFHKKYRMCPVCNTELDEQYLRLYYFNRPYDRQQLKEKLIARLRMEKSFRYVYERRITLKLPCIICFLDLLQQLNFENVTIGVKK